MRLENHTARVYRVLWSLSDVAGGELRKPAPPPAPPPEKRPGAVRSWPGNVRISGPVAARADAAFRNARQNSDDANARIEHDRVLARIVTGMVKDAAELFKQFMNKRWITDRVFELACEQAAAPAGNAEHTLADSLGHCLAFCEWVVRFTLR